MQLYALPKQIMTRIKEPNTGHESIRKIHKNSIILQWLRVNWIF